MSGYLRPKAVAERLAISKKMVYKLIERRELEVLRIGRAVCVLVRSLDAFIARNTEAARETDPLAVEAPIPPPSSPRRKASGFVFLPPKP
jgi:excisionase family DNA binding protein